MNNRKKAIRKALIARLVSIIEDGELNLKIDDNRLYSMYSPTRKEYESPIDRSSNNYGYMTSSELEAGNVNIW